MPMLPQVLLDRLATAIEHATFLDRPADLLQGLTRRLPPGVVKDVLSGTPVGHPTHPLLVTVPIGAFVGATVLDVTKGDPAASRRLVGLGLLAAVPSAATGLSDWSDTDGAERRIGLVHAVGNVTGLALLGLSWFRRRSGDGGEGLTLAGLGALGVSGWLGGHLAYALGVGVDTTAFQRPPTDWTDALAEADLADGRPHAATVEDTPVLLVRHQGELRAIGDRCTHRGAPLHEGSLVDGCIECPWHGSRFALADGAIVRGPATRPQPAFEARVVDGRVQVRRAEVRSLRLNPTS